MDVPRSPPENLERIQRNSQATQRAAELATEEGRLEQELAEHHRELQKTVRQPGVDADSELATARLADLQERIASVERRLTGVRDEVERLRRDMIDEAGAARALAEFDPVWESLSPHEQARLLHLLIEQIDYDGRDGMISITFHASGIKTLADRQFQGDAA